MGENHKKTRGRGDSNRNKQKRIFGSPKGCDCNFNDGACQTRIKNRRKKGKMGICVQCAPLKAYQEKKIHKR